MEKLNIAELLKDCPKGTRLYSPILGDCTLREVFDSLNKHPYHIEVEFLDIAGNKKTDRFTEYGLVYYQYLGECVLFPSKGHRTWEDWDEYKINCLPKPQRPTTYEEACEILRLPVETYAHPWLKLNVLGRAWNMVDKTVDDGGPRYYPLFSKHGTACLLSSGFTGVPAVFRDEKTAAEFGKKFEDLYLKLQ